MEPRSWGSLDIEIREAVTPSLIPLGCSAPYKARSTYVGREDSRMGPRGGYEKKAKTRFQVTQTSVLGKRVGSERIRFGIDWSPASASETNVTANAKLRHCGLRC
jgi:hypothetical protein